MKIKFYFDNDEEGLSPETSHPNFNEIIKEDFYFDCSDDFSPFGNDDGAEALYALTDWYVEKKGKGSILRWLYNHIDDFGFKYQSKGASKILNIDEINTLMEEDEFFIKCMDETIIAVAFGQYKIEGTIDKSLKEIAVIAIERQMIINMRILSNGDIDLNKLYIVVDGISTRPDNRNSTSSLTEKYIERLEIMKNDLLKFKEKI